MVKQSMQWKTLIAETNCGEISHDGKRNQIKISHAADRNQIKSRAISSVLVPIAVAISLVLVPIVVAMIQPLRNSMKKRKVVSFGLMVNLQHRTIATGVRKTELNTHNDFTETIETICKQGLLNEALQFLHLMDQCVNSSCYQCILHCCIQKRALPEGKIIHAHMNMNGFVLDKFLHNTLVDMYARCGNLKDARKVFNEMPERTIFSWTMMISAYNRHGFAEEALALYHEMQSTGVEPDGFIFATVLRACGKLSALEQGKELHEEIAKRGFECDVVVGNALVGMYAKCGSLDKARDVFDRMRQLNAVSWTVMIGGYAESGLVDEALEFFRKMLAAGVKPDSKTFASVLPACSSLATMDQGLEIHKEVIRSGIEYGVFVGSALVDMYAKCGRLEDARYVFDKMPQRNVISWTAMIAGYAQTECAAEALWLFNEMRLASVKPDKKTFACVLSACASLAALQQGMEIHDEIIKREIHGDVIVGSALVDMYAKCGKIAKARDIFDKMSHRDVVLWNAMITAYSRDGQAEEALTLFSQMKQSGIQLSHVTFASALSSCAKLAALEQGMEIHEELIRSGLELNSFVENALVDMYIKCGNIEKALHLFERIDQRNVVSWNAMIGGYAMHGCGNEALNLFEQMQQAGINPNHVTLLCVLSACCHAGLVKEGQEYFYSMSQRYNISPTVEHYSCMVDLLGRAGHLGEAEDFINKMPVKPNANVRHCLLEACGMHNNIDPREHVTENFFELDSKDAAS